MTRNLLLMSEREYIFANQKYVKYSQLAREFKVAVHGTKKMDLYWLNLLKHPNPGAFLV